MKFNPFDGVQVGDWALMEGVAARARHANARKACFICDLLGGVYISGHAPRPRTDDRKHESASSSVRCGEGDHPSFRDSALCGSASTSARQARSFLATSTINSS